MKIEMMPIGAAKYLRATEQAVSGKGSIKQTFIELYFWMTGNSGTRQKGY